MAGISLQPLSSEEDALLEPHYQGFGSCGSPFVKVHPGNYILPAAYSKYKDIFRDWKVQASDIYVITFPKNGTTLTQELAWCVQNNCNLEEAKTTLLDQRVPFLDLPMLLEHFSANLPVDPRKVIEDMEKMPAPRILKSHLPLALLPNNLLDKSKVISCLRNPKDTVVSFYHHEKLFVHHNYVGDFPSYFNFFMDSISLWSPFFNFVAELWNEKDHPNMCLLFFEEMLQDKAGSIRKISKFLGKSLSETEVDKLADHLSFKKMKENPAVNKEEFRGMGLYTNEGSFLRKGQVGDWKEYFDDEMNKRMDEAIKKHFDPIGLHFCYE